MLFFIYKMLIIIWFQESQLSLLSGCEMLIKFERLEWCKE